MNKSITRDLVESAKDIRESGHRKPLRSHKELCVEFGVQPRTLSNYLRRDDAPKPRFAHRSASACNTYYVHDEIQKWWAGLQK